MKITKDDWFTEASTQCLIHQDHTKYWTSSSERKADTGLDFNKTLRMIAIYDKERDDTGFDYNYRCAFIQFCLEKAGV
jgi:hypothetical protein